MPVDRTTIAHVASLARLDLDAAEAERLAEDFERLLSWVDGLAEVDTEGVEPMTQPAEGAVLRRTDLPRPSLSREEALGNAPEVAEGAFVVPPVLPGEEPG